MSNSRRANGSVDDVTYLDHAASTPLRPSALEAMLPYLRDDYGNPSGTHALGRRARRALDEARGDLSVVLCCEDDEVFFTSGGTEADNLAVLGAGAREGAVLVSSVEHKAVLEPARRLLAIEIPVTNGGVIDLGELERLCPPHTALFSLMGVNSETGVIQPVAEAAAIVHDRAPDAIVHCDAVQAMPWLDVGQLCADVDLFSISAHKVGGPKGAGALVVRRNARARLSPLLYGGGQERELRPGTENVAGAVGFAAAATVTAGDRVSEYERVSVLRDELADGLLAIDGVSECAQRSSRVPGNCQLRFPGVEAEELLFVLDELGLAASAGSACASGALEPSHVLLAMGYSPRQSRQVVRFSLGYASSHKDVDAALRLVPEALAQLGSFQLED